MLSVQITPDRHAYFAGETVKLRIRFVNGAAEEAKPEREGLRRLGLVGSAVDKVEERSGETEEEGRGTPTPTAPIPQHHPHARKVSIAQAPTPTPIDSPSRHSSLGTIPELTSDVQPRQAHIPTAKHANGNKRRDAVITFATIQPHATFTPSPAYIPPEPLLPLRNLLSHQPIGQGHHPTASTPHLALIDRAAGGDGLTSSLSNLARGLFGEHEEGTWDGRRREVWLGRGLAVWIGGREVLGVDLKVGEGGVVDYQYAVPIPPLLPPTFKGKSIAFAYAIRLSLSVALPDESAAASPRLGEARSWGLWNRTKVKKDTTPPQRIVEKELSVSIRVLPNVTVPPTTETHDLLRPIIARTSDATVTRLSDTPSSAGRPPPPDPEERERTFGGWMKGLVDEVKGEREANGGAVADSIERMHGREAVQALIYSSRPGRFEIVKRHHGIAVLSLPRTAWRTGEAVHGLVQFHRPGARFDVLKVSIDLVTTETIPPPLLPTSTTAPEAGPILRRTIATYGNAYTTDLATLGFSLGIPKNATAGFGIGFGNAADGQGGLAWALHVRFLVTVRRAETRQESPHHGDLFWERSGMTGELVLHGQAHESKLDVDIVECTIPLTVLPHDEGKAETLTFEI